MPDRVAAFSIRLEGTKELRDKLEEKNKEVRGALYDSMLLASLKIRGRVVASFGTPGFPRRQTGALSRGVRAFAERTPTGARAVVGVAATVPYGRILELGGEQPARWVAPRRRKALRWTTGMTRLGSVASLGFGLTRKQAFGAPKTKKGRMAERADTLFSRGHMIPARYQRAIPYLGPALLAEREAIEKILKERLEAVLKD